MRLDKFLKVSRIIKRRTLAKEVSDQGRVKVNGNVAKASTNVAIGDELIIRFGQRIVTIEITELKEHANKDNAKQMFEVLKEERLTSE